MGGTNHPPERRMSRRSFLYGTGVGLAAGASASWLALRQGHDAEPPPPPRPAFTGRSAEVAKPALAMPGPFPGRVIEVRHPESVRADHAIAPEAVAAMMERGLCALTGADHAVEAWRRLFQPGDVVGIKVNPVGRAYRRDQVAAVSSFPVVLETVAGLKSAGVRPADIILFDRYADQFRSAGYEALLREPALAGVRWLASSFDYDNRQVDIRGNDLRRDPDPHVVGYDPDVFATMAFAAADHDPRDDRRLRSHLSLIVTRMVNKIVNIPVLKDHGSAGVTLALKNLSHGLNNNVARSHLARVARLDGVSGPNQCNTFIPTAAGQAPIRQKAALHILDGLIGVYQGGPACERTWPYRGLLFATDPVALDHVGWDIIDRKRVREGLPPVAKMSLLSALPAERQAGGRPEVFDRRQPEHIILAGTIGLGVFDAAAIEHRRLTWDAVHGTWTHGGQALSS